MKVLVCSATRMEIAVCLDQLIKQFDLDRPDVFVKSELEVSILVTGVGLPLTSFALGQVLSTNRYDLVIQAGVAGAIDRQLKLGQVVQVVRESFADLGVEEADGRFTSMHQLDLIPADQPPFQKGQLVNETDFSFLELPKVAGISVNKVHGFAPSIQQLEANYPNAQVESMEGASFFYACLMAKQPFIQLRSISNYVEERNRDNWQLGMAVAKLNEVLWEMIDGFGS